MAPTIPQLRFLSLPHFEAFYGGAAGGGKSEALLMAALLYADEPDYAAMIFRKTYRDLALDGALMDRAKDWLVGTAAKWNDTDKRWTFPKGATLSFGYLDGPEDWRRYDSAEYQFEGFDESTQLRAKDYTSLLGRLRRKVGSRVPLRARSASNPGGESHEFFGERFVEPEEPHPERAFVPALLEDNPHLDRAEYEKALTNLDETLYKQRRFGLWIRDAGEGIYKPEWWVTDERRYRLGPNGAEGPPAIGRYLSFDTAHKDKDSNDWTACCVFELTADYQARVVEVWRERMQFPSLLSAVEQAAEKHNRDGLLSGVIIEDKGSGTSALQTLALSAEDWLAELLIPFMPQGSKDERDRQAALYGRVGAVLLPYPNEHATWFKGFTEEELFVGNPRWRDRRDAFTQGVLFLERYLAEWYRLRMRFAV